MNLSGPFVRRPIATVLLTVSPVLMRALGDRGLRALERLMGMLLVLLATQMLLNGVREFVESLAV